jgi:hypothetical protein
MKSLAFKPQPLTGFVDVSVADEWRDKHLEQAKRPGSPNARARLRKLEAEASMAEMKAAQLSGVLNPVADGEFDCEANDRRDGTGR